MKREPRRSAVSSPPTGRRSSDRLILDHADRATGRASWHQYRGDVPRSGRHSHFKRSGVSATWTAAVNGEACGDGLQRVTGEKSSSSAWRPQADFRPMSGGSTAAADLATIVGAGSLIRLVREVPWLNVPAGSLVPPVGFEPETDCRTGQELIHSGLAISC